MLGLPKTSMSIEEVADIIREEDTAKEKRTGERSSDITSEVCGIVVINTPNKKEVHIPIEQSKNYDYQNDHIVVEKETPKACFIKTTEGNFFIAVDDVFIKWIDDNSPKWKQTIAEAILYHETGHYLAGHLNETPSRALMLDRIDVEKLKKANDPFPLLAEALLNGAVFDIELEADIQAMNVIDDPMKIVSLHSYLASTSDTLGVRMEHSNRVDRLIEHLEDNVWDDSDISEVTSVDFCILPEDEEEKD